MEASEEQLIESHTTRGAKGMTKRKWFAFGGFAASALLFGAQASAQVITLTLTDQNPPSAWGSIHAMDPWVKRVQEATKGRVKIQVYYSQTLSKGPDAFNAVKSGVADMCWCFHGYWADMTPLSDVITLPFLPFSKAEKGSEVLWKLYEKFPSIQREYRDVVPLMLWTSDPYFLATTKKQVKTLEDLKGMRLRVPGGPPTATLRALGAVPTLIPMPDNYMALDKGTIDGMGTPWEPLHGFRIHEVVRYYTMVPMFSVYFSMSMNKQKWESLPKDIQQAMMSVSGLEGSKFWGRNFFDTAEQGVHDLVRKTNRQIIRYDLPPQEVERWRKVAGNPLWKDWVKRMEDKGRPEAKQILNATLEMLSR
jgi:TRAP-type transport system periplasmic protein